MYKSAEKVGLMKSIMQEASSITKALEKAWQNAGRPREFSIKIYEEPEKNFLGMTTKSAKIAIFFTQEAIEKREQKPKVKAEITHVEQPEKMYEPKKQQVKVPPSKKPLVMAPKQQRALWSDEMVSLASTWINNALKAMEKPKVSFSTNVNNYYLRFTFNAPLADSPEKERQIFRSFSFLVLQALKRQLKRPLRGFKVVLTREQ